MGSVPAEDLEVGTAQAAEDGFGDLAAGAVARAHEEDADRRVGHRSFLPSAAGAPGGGDRLLEVDQFGVEAVQVVALAGDLRPLRRP